MQFFTVIDHVQLAMPPGEEQKARSFYAGILGMAEIEKPSELAKRGGVWFASANVQIHLGVEQDFRPAKKAHPALRSDRYDELMAHLLAQKGGDGPGPVRPWNSAVLYSRLLRQSDRDHGCLTHKNVELC